MRLFLSRLGRDLNRFEILLAVVMILVLFAVLQDRVQRKLDEVERFAVATTLTNLETAVKMRASALLLGGRFRELAGLETENPVNEFAQPPGGYLGEDPDAAAIAPGSWYFQRGNRMLVYMPRSGVNRDNGEIASGALHFRLRLLFLDGNGDGRFQPPGESFQGARLEPATPGGAGL